MKTYSRNFPAPAKDMVRPESSMSIWIYISMLSIDMCTARSTSTLSLLLFMVLDRAWLQLSIWWLDFSRQTWFAWPLTMFKPFSPVDCVYNIPHSSLLPPSLTLHLYAAHLASGNICVCSLWYSVFKSPPSDLMFGIENEDIKPKTLQSISKRRVLVMLLSRSCI